MINKLESLHLELNNCTELLKIDYNEINTISDFGNEDHIELKEKDRGCRIYPYYFSEIPIYEFEWDGCLIFKMSSNDVERQIEILKNWLIERIMPSEIKALFPEIQLNKIAKYYEKGEGVKGEFIESWNETVKYHFSPIEYDSDKEAIELIEEMRAKGLNESLRIGTRLSWLIISRARRHIINDSTPYIGIYLWGNSKMKVYSNLNGENIDIEVEAKYDGFLETLIKELLKEEIR